MTRRATSIAGDDGTTDRPGRYVLERRESEGTERLAALRPIEMHHHPHLARVGQGSI